MQAFSVFRALSACAAAAVLALVSGAAWAQNYVNPFDKDDVYIAADPEGLVVLSYQLGFGEAFPADFHVIRVDPETGAEEPVRILRLTRRFLGIGAVLGQRRYMSKAFPFIRRNTYFYTIKLPPGLYAVAGAGRALTPVGGSGWIDQYEPTLGLTFAFEVKAGSVNYIGDFEWGWRSRRLCAITGAEAQTAADRDLTQAEYLCYTKFRELMAEWTARPPEGRGSPPDYVAFDERFAGLGDNPDFRSAEPSTREAVIRTYFGKYRPKVAAEAPIIPGAPRAVSLQAPLGPQLAGEPAPGPIKGGILDVTVFSLDLPTPRSPEPATIEPAAVEPG